MENLNEFFNWIIYSGGAMLIASKILDLIPAFTALESKVKWLINGGISLALAVGAFALLTYLPADVVAVIDPWFKIIAGFIAAYSGQQAIHQLTK